MTGWPQATLLNVHESTCALVDRDLGYALAIMDQDRTPPSTRWESLGVITSRPCTGFPRPEVED
jgi:hypothetical protein